MMNKRSELLNDIMHTHGGMWERAKARYTVMVRHSGEGRNPESQHSMFNVGRSMFDVQSVRRSTFTLIFVKQLGPI